MYGSTRSCNCPQPRGAAACHLDEAEIRTAPPKSIDALVARRQQPPPRACDKSRRQPATGLCHPRLHCHLQQPPAHPLPPSMYSWLSWRVADSASSALALRLAGEMAAAAAAVANVMAAAAAAAANVMAPPMYSGLSWGVADSTSSALAMRFAGGMAAAAAAVANVMEISAVWA